jgi:hypothetical protein
MVTEPHLVFVEIDRWYASAPEGMDENELVRWVQHNADIACPQCGDSLWVLRTRRAMNRGWYHLAMCRNEECDFQIDD